MISEEEFVALTSILTSSSTIERHLAAHLLLYGIPRYYHVNKGFNFANQCNICLENLHKGVVRLKCNHFFHENCVQEWLLHGNTCPTCRYPI